MLLVVSQVMPRIWWVSDLPARICITALSVSLSWDWLIKWSLIGGLRQKKDHCLSSLSTEKKLLASQSHKGLNVRQLHTFSFSPSFYNLFVLLTLLV